MTVGLPGAGTLTLIALAGGAGAVLRYALDTGVRRATQPRGPLGILLVNLIASAAIGGLAGAGLAGAGLTSLGAGDSHLGLVLATGLIGGFSTLSTVAVDSATLAAERRWVWLVCNTAGMLVVSLALCWCASLLVGSLTH